MKKIITVVGVLCLLGIVIIGAVYFLPYRLLPKISVVDSVKEYICSVQKGDYRCSYGWGKDCYCQKRWSDGGKSCTNSSQCSSNKCVLSSSQLKQLGFNDLYINSNEINTNGDSKKCLINGIDKLSENIAQNGQCQEFPLDDFSWHCIGVLNNGNVKFECGCAIQ